MTCYYFYLWDERFRAGVRQGLRLLPVSDQDLGQRPRVGQTAGRPGRDRVHRAVQRVRLLPTIPPALQAICDRLGPGTIQVFSQRWWSRLPLPLTEHDRGRRATGGSCRCARSRSRAPWCSTRRARPAAFFEALVTDNLDIGRPETDRADLRPRIQRRPARPTARRVQDQDRHPRHRGHRQRLLQALPHQAVLEGRAGAADRDRDQRPRRPGLPAPPAAISTNCRPRPVRSTPRCSILNVSARAASLRVQPLSGSRSPPSPRTAGGPRPYGSATLGSKPWPAPCAPTCSPSPASPTRACAP